MSRTDEFIGEEIAPSGGPLDPARMAMGGPSLPRCFVWRDREHAVREVLRRWKETSRCRSGSREQYVRKHWFVIRTADGSEMRVYFERQARSPRRAARWWLYSLSTPDKPTV